MTDLKKSRVRTWAAGDGKHGWLQVDLPDGVRIELDGDLTAWTDLVTALAGTLNVMRSRATGQRIETSPEIKAKAN